MALVALASFVMLACQNKQKSKDVQGANVPPAPSTVLAPIDAGSKSAVQSATKSLSAQEIDAFVKELFERNVVAFSKGTETALWCDSYHFEGDGMTTVYRKKQGDPEAVEIVEFQIGSDEYDEQRAKAAQTIAALLRKDNFLPLDKTEWQASESKVLVRSIDRVFVWNEMTLSIARPGQEPVKLSEYQISEPHVPGATAIYAGAGIPVVVVEITYDPGSEYIDGYTVHRKMDVFTIPE